MADRIPITLTNSRPSFPEEGKVYYKIKKHTVDDKMFEGNPIGLQAFRSVAAWMNKLYTDLVYEEKHGNPMEVDSDDEINAGTKNDQPPDPSLQTFEYVARLIGSKPTENPWTQVIEEVINPKKITKITPYMLARHMVVAERAPRFFSSTRGDFYDKIDEVLEVLKRGLQKEDEEEEGEENNIFLRNIEKYTVLISLNESLNLYRASSVLTYNALGYDISVQNGENYGNTAVIASFLFHEEGGNITFIKDRSDTTGLFSAEGEPVGPDKLPRADEYSYFNCLNRICALAQAHANKDDTIFTMDFKYDESTDYTLSTLYEGEQRPDARGIKIRGDIGKAIQTIKKIKGTKDEDEEYTVQQIAAADNPVLAAQDNERRMDDLREQLRTVTNAIAEEKMKEEDEFFEQRKQWIQEQNEFNIELERLSKKLIEKDPLNFVYDKIEKFREVGNHSTMRSDIKEKIMEDFKKEKLENWMRDSMLKEARKIQTIIEDQKEDRDLPEPIVEFLFERLYSIKQEYGRLFRENIGIDVVTLYQEWESAGGGGGGASKRATPVGARSIPVTAIPVNAGRKSNLVENLNLVF